MKKVIIADDEAAGRKLIKEYIAAYPEWIVLGEANNGVDAVKLINEFKPDLVFLDIQMPGLTGFEVLTHLEELPQVIFLRPTTNTPCKLLRYTLWTIFSSPTPKSASGLL